MKFLLFPGLLKSWVYCIRVGPAPVLALSNRAAKAVWPYKALQNKHTIGDIG